MHVQSVDQVKAIKTIKRKITDLQKMTIEEQKKAVRAGYDMDIIPSDLATYGTEAKKLLRGTIDFVHGCVGAKGDEKEDVLLVGDNMVNQTIPLILCAEEDVEGNHGASIGKLDENMLFYAATRGIPPEEAQRLLTLAKIEAINSQIPSEEVRGAVDTYLKEQCI